MELDIEKEINNLIPVGSIVKLKGVKNKVMITKYHFEDNKAYKGVLWPLGEYDTGTAAFFNTEDIEKVYFRGFENNELEEYKKQMISILKENSDSTINEEGV
jgi:hypothetical protein